jgi:hypothetical protein
MEIKNLLISVCLPFLMATPALPAMADVTAAQQQNSTASTQGPQMEHSLMEIQSQMNHMFDNFFNAGGGPGWSQVTSYSPAINVSDGGNKIVVTVDLPGLDIKDIVASVNGNTLTAGSNGSIIGRALSDKNNNLNMPGSGILQTDGVWPAIPAIPAMTITCSSPGSGCNSGNAAAVIGLMN